jgi:hypothetical protein
MKFVRSLQNEIIPFVPLLIEGLKDIVLEGNFFSFKVGNSAEKNYNFSFSFSFY